MCIILAGAFGCQSPDASRYQLAGYPAEVQPTVEATRTAHQLEDRNGGVFDNEAILRNLHRIAVSLQRRTAPQRENWKVQILNTDKVNGFGLPNGSIYLTRGLYQMIQYDDDLIAAVIAHEMAHLEAGDCYKEPPKTKDEALRREICADLRAADFLRAAGYNPQSLVELLSIIEQHQPAGWAQIRQNAISQTLSMAP